MLKTITKQRALLSSLGIVIALILFFSPVPRTPFLDTATDNYFNEAITKAGLAYGTCRAINASVSIIKDSKLQLEPAGVGVSLAVGQILDPIDDMTERLSDVLVTAITSLSVQKLSYEIAVSLAPRLFAVFLVLLSIVMWLKSERLACFHSITTRILIFIAIIRFCLPLSSIVNDLLYDNYFADKITKANNELTLRSEASSQFGDIAIPDSNGFWASVGNSTTVIKKISGDFKQSLAVFVNNMGEIVENLLHLTFLYVSIFLIQVILLPLLMFWLFLTMANSLFLPYSRRPVIKNNIQVSNE